MLVKFTVNFGKHLTLSAVSISFDGSTSGTSVSKARSILTLSSIANGLEEIHTSEKC